MIDLAQTVLEVTLRIFFAAWCLAATAAVLVFLLFVIRAAAVLSGAAWLNY